LLLKNIKSKTRKQ